jgi:hypothetical protein
VKVTGKIKKYFEYEDKLSTVVSLITGILIIIYNISSGILIIYLTYELFFGIKTSESSVLLLLIIPGTITGAGILRICILLINMITKGTEVEKYSYLRLVLFVSVLAYMFILCIILFKLCLVHS